MDSSRFVQVGFAAIDGTQFNHCHTSVPVASAMHKREVLKTQLDPDRTLDRAQVSRGEAADLFHES